MQDLNKGASGVLRACPQNFRGFLKYLDQRMIKHNQKIKKLNDLNFHPVKVVSR